MQRFPHVLVVDDSVTVRVTLEKALTDAGYLVRTTAWGHEALQLLGDRTPSYIILDRSIQDLNSHELCRRIRSSQTGYIYLMLMTGYSDMMDLVDGLGAGADDYITKPIEIRELLARMQAGARVLELDQQLNQLAKHDPLTGVLNRRDLLTTVDRLMETSRRAGRTTSCVMVDIDHFKSINDELGHLAGDEVLIRVAEVLQQQARSADVVCRFGGEEFVILFPDCRESQAAQYADRCRQEISRHAAGGSQRPVTASFGVADSQSCQSALQLIHHADVALINAKRCGRNRVQQFTHLAPEDIFLDSASLLSAEDFSI